MDGFYGNEAIRGHSVARKRTKGVRGQLGFCGVIDAEVERLMVRRHFGKARNYRTARASFSGFLASVLGVDDIGVERIDARLIERYARWLELRGVRRNTVSFYMRVLRAVYNRIARARTNPFASVYTGVDATVKRHISRDVVVQLARLNLRDNRGLAMARDLFLFSLLMRGMPFVDIAYAKMCDIRDNTLCYRRRKTGQMMRVRIEPQAWTIIRRYHVEGSAMVFPLIASDDEAVAYRQYRSALSLHNKRLKAVSAMLGGGVHLSSYVARHTWASLAQECSLPMHIISTTMGHTSERTTRIYLGTLDDSLIDRACRKVWKKLKIPTST